MLKLALPLTLAIALVVGLFAVPWMGSALADDSELVYKSFDITSITSFERRSYPVYTRFTS